MSDGPFNDLRVANWLLYAYAIDNMVLNHKTSASIELIGVLLFKDAMPCFVLQPGGNIGMRAKVTIPAVVLAVCQSSEAESEKELIDKLARAQSHATRLIHKQAKKIETLQSLLIESISGHVADKFANKS